MKRSDEIVLDGLEPFALQMVSAEQWVLTKQAVADAGGILASDGVVRDLLEKASFASRSEAGRYAANMRWKGNAKGDDANADPASPDDEQSAKMATRARSIAEGDLSDIASIIRRDFREQGKKIPPAAQPYLDALSTLGTVDDQYGMDSGKSIVAYALSNLGSYKGETARLVKAELKARLKGKKADARVNTPDEDKAEIKRALDTAEGDLEVEIDINGAGSPMATAMRTNIERLKSSLGETNDSPDRPDRRSVKEIQAQIDRLKERQSRGGPESSAQMQLDEKTIGVLERNIELRQRETNDSPEFTGRTTGRQGGPSVGPKYKKGMSLKEITASVRQDVKAIKLPPGVKLGVRMRDGLAVVVDIKGYTGDQNSPEAKALRAEIEAVRDAYNRSNSDPMSDYSDETYYGNTDFN